jgi:hypothetical protein
MSDETNDGPDPAIMAIPAHILFRDAAEAAEADRLNNEAAQAAEAERQRRDAEAQELTEDQRLQALAEVVREQDPPSADELDVDVDGLPPARARLVRFAAWQRSLQEQLDSQETGRAAFMEQMGAPARTEEKIAQLIEADTSNFLRWLRNGAAALTKPQVRAFEREALEKRLAGDHHEAEIARAALKRLEEDAAVLRRQIEILRRRQPDLVRDVLLEEASAGAGARYEAARQAMEAALTELLGLAHVVGGHRNYRSQWFTSQDASIPLPSFQLPGLPGYRGGLTVKLDDSQRPAINVTDKQSREAAVAWRDRLHALAHDPRS